MTDTTQEEWMLIPWSNGLYYASNLGRVKRVESLVRNQSDNKENIGYRKVGGNILKPKTKKNGYMEVNMYISAQKGKMCHVHRAVYFAFNPNSDQSLQINHKNYDRSDNRLDNLELVTASQNMIHANKGGRIKRIFRIGQDSPASKLTNDDIIKIRQIHKDTKAVTRIAKMFGIGKTQVQRIVRRESWDHI